MIRPMCVVLEGPEGSGKSTLARKLQYDFGLKYHHEGPPPGGLNRDAILRHYLDPIVHLRVPTVFDRLGYGERVYGPLLRNGTTFNSFALRAYMELVRAYGTHIVCYTSLANTRRVWENDVTRRKAITYDNLMRARLDYVCNSSKFDIHYDYAKANAYDLVKTCIEDKHRKVLEYARKL